VQEFLNSEFGQNVTIAVIQTCLPIVLLLGGGQWLLARYNLNQKKKEQQLEIAPFVRERQYEALLQIYGAFSGFMRLYRETNSRETDLQDKELRTRLLEKCYHLESSIDSSILRIASEFTHTNRARLENLLGNLRQSAQLFRERIANGETLPFVHPEQPDYLRFKNAFTETGAYIASLIYDRLDPSDVDMEEAKELLRGVFSVKYEEHGAHFD
jgi:hypothetical protein